MASPAPPANSGASGGRGSSLRLLTGMVLFVVALAIAAFGFATLVRVLDSGGYGTPAMRQALLLMGIAGAFLAGAIATIIWDISKRYER